MLNTDEGNPIATEVEYGGLNDCRNQLTEMWVTWGNHEEPRPSQLVWLKHYLDYVDFLN